MKHEFVPNDIQRIQTQKSLDARLKCVYDYKEDSKKSLLDLIDSAGIERIEVFAGKSLDEPKITIISPTKDYYESLLPKFRNRLNFHWVWEASEENMYSTEGDASDETTLSMFFALITINALWNIFEKDYLCERYLKLYVIQEVY